MSALPLIGLDCLLEAFDDGFDGLANSAGQRHRIGAGGEVAIAFLENRLGQHGRGGRAVTGDVAGLAGGFLDQLGADVLEFVLEFDFLGDGNAVLGDGWRAPAFVDHGISSPGPEGGFDRPGELDYPFEKALSCVRVKRQHLRRHVDLLRFVNCDLKPARNPRLPTQDLLQTGCRGECE